MTAADHQVVLAWRQSTDSIPETTRRALKFASTPPCGPVFLSPFPTICSRERASSADLMEAVAFDVPMRIRPDQTDIEKVGASC